MKKWKQWLRSWLAAHGYVQQIGRHHIFVIAGNYMQAANYMERLRLNPSQWTYVRDFHRLAGVEYPKVLFVGTWTRGDFGCVPANIGYLAIKSPFIRVAPDTDPVPLGLLGRTV